ncbi:hypothetical protein E2C06_35165 [Dankookia rubra]|uniref:AAA family ATPase n=1 Tax=Dankookia rubra TaxID=1442381 RepID=A0A4R5Q4S8_9PROT|nr:AAA family ATPase [Dankookia rubra]TDH57952.1 hypothetical protein E2C06_35165 [Dankookia rubra]
MDGHPFDRDPPGRKPAPWEVPDQPWVADPHITAPPRGIPPKPPAGAAPNVLTRKRLLEMDLPPQRYTVPGLLPVGYTVFGATPKFGKSWLMLDLVLAATVPGWLFLGREVQQGRVLYLSLEDSLTRLRDRTLKLLGDAIGAGEDCHYCIEWPRLDDGGLEWLEWWIASHVDPTGERSTTVIIDTGQSIRPPAILGSANWYEADSQFHKTFRDLALRWGVCILLITHTTKGRKDDPFESIQGTMGVLGIPDAIWVGQRERGENDATLHFMGRDVNTDALALEFNDGRWTYLGLASEVRQNQTNEAILATLRVTDGMSPAEVAIVTDMPVGRVKKAIWLMSQKEPSPVYVESGRYYIRKM